MQQEDANNNTNTKTMKEEEKNPFSSDRTTTPPLHCLFIFNPAASQFMFPESNFHGPRSPLTSPRAFCQFCADRRADRPLALFCGLVFCSFRLVLSFSAPGLTREASPLFLLTARAVCCPGLTACPPLLRGFRRVVGLLYKASG